MFDDDLNFTFKITDTQTATITFTTEPNTSPQDWRKVAELALSEACKVADATGKGFNWNIAYGMGGSYTPKPLPKKLTRNEALALLKTGDYLSADQRKAIATAIEDGVATLNEWDESTDYGWNSSSSMC